MKIASYKVGSLRTCQLLFAFLKTKPKGREGKWTLFDLWGQELEEIVFLSLGLIVGAFFFPFFLLLGILKQSYVAPGWP